MTVELNVETQGPVLIVTMNRPPANAMTTTFSTELFRVFERLNSDESLRVAVLTAERNPKGIFCGGWDLKAVAMGEGRDDEQGFDLGPGGIGGLTEYFDLVKPVIVAVNGAAVGGGFEIALSGDLVLATEDAYFALPEMQRGFLPDGGAVQRLHRRIPYNVAIELMLTGRRLGAQEAKHWGFVNEVTTHDRLRPRAIEIAQGIAGGAPLVSAALKEYMRATAHVSIQEAHAITRRAWVGKSGMPHYERMLQSDDFNEGAVAFSEKRKSVFKGV